MQHVLKILKFTSHLKFYYLSVSFFSVFLALIGLLTPFFSGLAIDEIRLGQNAQISKLIWLAVGIFALDFSSTIINNFNGYVGDQMGAKVQQSLSTKYYSKLLELPQDYFDNELSGKIIARLNRSIEQISRFITMMSNNFLQFIFSTVFSLGVILIYSWQVALLLFALYPIFIYMTVKSSSTWQGYQKKKNHHKDIAGGRFAEAINQMKVLKSFTREKSELSYFDGHMAEVVKINRPQSKFWHKEDIKRRVILNLIFLGVYVFIFYQAAQGDFSTGEAVALILYAMQIRIPIFTISYIVESTQRAVADSQDYFEVMDLKSIENHTDNKTKLKVTNGKIEFKDVDFSYTDNSRVLKNFNLEIPAKKTIALVGESGEGKTTITNLLMKLYAPDSGSIEIDGQNIGALSLKELRSNIGVVFQDASLFSGTISENIKYGMPKATAMQIQKAAKSANAHDFIDDLEEGYYSEIGERGLKLSGGQKQRIAIARALLKDAPILILDEATSSLDSRSEQFVQDALDVLMKDRTTIIIAHRLSTIQNVDLLITLKDGQVDEIGSPSKLAKTDGIYANLLELQANGKAKKKLKKFDIQA